LAVLSILLLGLHIPDSQAKRMTRRGGPALHYTAVPAKQPAEIDLAIVMLDNRRIAGADSVASQKNAPCDDYWSASVAINRLFAELHGYHFYLWHDTHNAVRSCGCVEDDEWLDRAMVDILNPDPKKLHPAWQKMLPIYCHLKQHKMVMWIDSDAYVADITQPIELLLHATRFIEGGKSMMISLDHPKQAGCKGCSGENGPGLNTGILLLQNTENGIGLEMLRNWMGATFSWGDREKVSTSNRWRTHWPWEQMAVNSGEKNLAISYKDDIVVLPYATPINGPHGQYMVHLWGYITGYGKKCKILREALKCSLDAIPAEHRACYLRHASARAANDTAAGPACGWRPSKTAAGGMLPPGPRTRCAPTCAPAAARLEKKLVEQPPGQPLYGAVGQYKYRPVGLKACDNKKVGIAQRTVAEPNVSVPLAAEAAWELVTTIE